MGTFRYGVRLRQLADVHSAELSGGLKQMMSSRNFVHSDSFDPDGV